MKYLSMTILSTLVRVISVFFNYVVVRVMTVFEYASYSNFLSVCNMSYQIFRLGYEYEFQKLIHDADQTKSVLLRPAESNALLLSVSAVFAFLATTVAFLTLKFGFSPENNLFGVPYFAVLFFVSSLFMTGIFMTNMYAAFNLRAMSFFCITNVIGYGVLVFGLTSGVKNEFLLLYSLFMLSAISLAVFIFCPISFNKINYDLAKSIIERAIKRTLPIYANNTSIVLVQIILIAMVSWNYVELIAEYRVLQSIQAVIAMIPIIMAVFLVNKSSAPRSETDFLSIVHVYFILGAIAGLAMSYISYLYPKYSEIIMTNLLMFIVINCTTVISNAFIFANYRSIDGKLYLKILPIFFLINIVICFMYEIESLLELLIVDWIIQLTFLLCVVISSLKSFNFWNYEILQTFTYVFILLVAIFNLNYFSVGFISLFMMVVSSYYLWNQHGLSFLRR
ncbi:hypothetical protein N9Y62_03315 [Luminiphilus sp.]|nr:hypothetical protein [Luminiphilus sp.]